MLRLTFAVAILSFRSNPAFSIPNSMFILYIVKKKGLADLPRLIRDGSAIPFTANARSPTVTMPRIKAITTGSIPSFVDLILNFDEGDTSSTLAVQDTWLAQLKAAERGKLLMFGDDTWLKLFPSTFDREDGTTSFFVAVSSLRHSSPQPCHADMQFF